MGVTTDLRKYLYRAEFCSELVLRYKRFEILCEAGLRTAVANLLHEKLQEFGDSAKGYRVAPEVRLKEMNVIPDVLIWKNNDPRIWIELKDTKRFEAKKAQADWQKLRHYCKKCPTVKTGYLIYVARQSDGDISIRRDRQTTNLWPIRIPLEQHIVDFERWDKEYERRAHYLPSKPKTKGGSTQSKARSAR